MPFIKGTLEDLSVWVFAQFQFQRFQMRFQNFLSGAGLGGTMMTGNKTTWLTLEKMISLTRLNKSHSSK